MKLFVYNFDITIIIILYSERKNHTFKRVSLTSIRKRQVSQIENTVLPNNCSVVASTRKEPFYNLIMEFSKSNSFDEAIFYENYLEKLSIFESYNDEKYKLFSRICKTLGTCIMSNKSKEDIINRLTSELNTSMYFINLKYLITEVFDFSDIESINQEIGIKNNDFSRQKLISMFLSKLLDNYLP